MKGCTQIPCPGLRLPTAVMEPSWVVVVQQPFWANSKHTLHRCCTPSLSPAAPIGPHPSSIGLCVSTLHRRGEGGQD